MDNKMGRPFISGKPKTVKITVLLDDDEHKLLKKLAGKQGITMSEYIRQLLKKEK